MVAANRWQYAEFDCEVLTADVVDLPLASQLIAQRLEVIARCCSTQDPDSEINHLEPGTTRISPTLTGAIAAGMDASELSNGSIPFTVIGTSHTEPLVLDRASHIITMPRNVDLDLAPVLSAWAADLLAGSCAHELGIGCLVNINGDIATQGPIPRGGWIIQLEDRQPALWPQKSLTMTWTGGLAQARPDDCSGPQGHPWNSVTVAATSCQRARAAALTALTLKDSAPRWLSTRELPARLVHVGGVVMQTPGWPGSATAQR